MTLIDKPSYEATLRRQTAARRLAVMPKPAARPGEWRLRDRLLPEETRRLHPDKATGRTRIADLLNTSAGTPVRDALLMILDEHFEKLHRRLDTIDRHAADLMFLQLCAQDLLIGKRRPFSGDSRDLITRVLGGEPYEGRCPCCMDEHVLAERAQTAPGAEFDHFFHRSLNRPEHGWLICRPCHRELTHDGYLARFGRFPEFRRFQAAVLRQRRRAQMRPDADGCS